MYLRVSARAIFSHTRFSSPNQHFTSAHITEMAKSVLNETVDFLIKKVENSSQTPLQKRKVNIREWVRHFHSQVTGKLYTR